MDIRGRMAKADEHQHYIFIYTLEKGQRNVLYAPRRDIIYTHFIWIRCNLDASIRSTIFIW